MLVMTSLHLLSAVTDSDTGGQVLVSEKQCVLCHVLYTRLYTDRQTHKGKIVYLLLLMERGYDKLLKIKYSRQYLYDA